MFFLFPVLEEFLFFLSTLWACAMVIHLLNLVLWHLYQVYVGWLSGNQKNKLPGRIVDVALVVPRVATPLRDIPLEPPRTEFISRFSCSCFCRSLSSLSLCSRSSRSNLSLSRCMANFCSSSSRRACSIASSCSRSS